MIGDIVVLTPGRLQEVAAEIDQRHVAGAERRAALRQPELQRLPQRHGRTRAAPAWPDVYGSKLTLANGQTHDWRTKPSARRHSQSVEHVTQGYAPIMPTYQGQISEDGVIALVEYIKNLNSELPRSADAEHDHLLPESEGKARYQRRQPGRSKTGTRLRGRGR